MTEPNAQHPANGNYREHKKAILSAVHQLEALVGDLPDIAVTDGAVLEEWSKGCATIRERLHEEVLRVAVVGTIKSGKSTFTNALLEGDYLRRGAGVITSIVTRIRSGKELRATLHFKTWTEINEDVRHALAFLEDLLPQREAAGFDLRSEEDRRWLQDALDGLRTEWVLEEGGQSAEVILLHSYLQGYDHVADRIRGEDRLVRFAGDRFPEHAPFVGSDALSVYLKDIRLEIDTGVMEENIEVADCQGSDSANPLHLAMIQDYLMTTHLIVYVVSSRTGLREADLKFLSIIRRMGISGNMLFVVNADFSEHDSLQDLQRVLGSVSEGLRRIVSPSDSDIHCFSALFALFRKQSPSLPEKDRLRLQQWEADAALTAFSTREYERFLGALQDKLDTDRARLLLNNHLQRLRVMAAGFHRWIGVHREILSGDREGAERMLQRVRSHKERTDQTALMARRALGGASMELQKEMKRAVDRFFSDGQGVVKDAVSFIRGWSLSAEGARRHLKDAGFTHALHAVFQEFRRGLDAYLAEEVNPAINRFVREQENEALAELAKVAAPHDLAVREVLVDTNAAAGDGPGHAEKLRVEEMPLPELEALKRSAGLSVPPAVAEIRYSARIRTDAAFRLGVYTVSGWLRRLFRKGRGDGEREKVMALRDGVVRMQREMEEAVRFHFKNYRENLKFQYMVRLVDAAAAAVFDALTARLQGYASDFSSILRLSDREGEEKRRAQERLESLAAAAQDLVGSLEGLRGDIFQKQEGGGP